MVEHPPVYRPTAWKAARVYLDVPYAEKDHAKALGARWDQTVKRWYDPRSPSAGLERWVARPDVPDLLPGEDRGFGVGLFVDMVPSSCWFTNVRTGVSQKDWERLRRMITRRAGQACEVCGAEEDHDAGRWLEAHERWAYDEHTGVQALRRLICLCSACHLSTHMGYATVTGRAEQARAHLRAVTGMTATEARRHVDTAGDLWTARSRRIWTLDLSMLTDAGVTLTRPEAAPDRPAAAQRALHQARGADQLPTQPTEPRTLPAPPSPPPRAARAPAPARDDPAPTEPSRAGRRNGLRRIMDPR